MRYFNYSIMLLSLLAGCSRTPAHVASVELPPKQSRVMEAMFKLPIQNALPPLAATPNAKLPNTPISPENAIPTDLPGMEQLHKIPTPEEMQGLANPLQTLGGQTGSTLPGMTGIPLMTHLPDGLNNGQPMLPMPVPGGAMSPNLHGSPVQLPILTPPKVDIPTSN
jgi:hypothetical protein